MILSFKEVAPKIAASAYVAPGAVVLGDVEIGERSSIWYGCVVRGDVHSIRIGSDTNIQDASVVHVTGGKFATTIGNRVTIGHRVLLHGCTLQDDSFVGMGATLLDGVVVEPLGFVAAGALVPPGFIVRSGWLALGSPAKLVRELREEERAMIERTWRGYVTNAELHRTAAKEVK
ncbi:gamma carbonic anhydrase family protein [Turneriella parva]|uniref:Transferase hexapeptide repeat containing protein n=1 Tax=Turneriella parva (strain ATCC BAA-1111 / DSM 21527 / NCTC 11395 / H) TaxID=869212 RepID=I4B8M6_TURPD|nr:gamma carbonic anhydrase family protein [Turneriella parva]AFM13633.1 transferase hexapeptide repeat containing protein [Turneriella parva DSM 21527]